MGRMPGKEVFGLTAIGQIRRQERKNLIAKNSLKNIFAGILVSFTDKLSVLQRQKRNCNKKSIDRRSYGVKKFI